MTRKRAKWFTVILICVAVIVSLSACSASRKQDTIAKLYFYGDMAEMYDKKDERVIAVQYVQGKTSATYYATIKVQGSSSLVYEKKNYTIKFYDDPAHENKSQLDLGWGAQNEYCLKANWIDKTHSRNVVSAKLAAEIQSKYHIMEQAPCNGLIDGFPVEIYINDQYHGLYTWNIPKSTWMFGMSEDDPNHIVMCGENWEDTVCFRALPDFESWSVEAGPENEETLEKFARMINFVMNSTDEEFRENFHQYLDLDSVLNYYIFVDFAYLSDNRGKNMLIATYDGNIWYPSLYDLDTSWGTYWNGLELFPYDEELVDFAGRSDLAKRIENVFSQELHDRYFELRKDILTKEHVLGLFQTFDESIPEDAKAREVERWGEDIPGYDLTQIEEYLDSIIPRLDEKYSSFDS